MSVEEQHDKLAMLAATVHSLADGVRDARAVLGGFDEGLSDVDAVRIEHIGLSLGWALDSLRSALFTIDSLAGRVAVRTLLPAPLRTYMRDNDEPPAEVTALSYANHGKTDYVVRNPAGGWDLMHSLDAFLPPTPGGTWSMVTKHIHVTMTEVRR